MRWLITSTGCVLECEKSGLSRIIDRDPCPESLDELHIQTLLQNEQAGLGVMDERARVGIGKNESEQACAIVQTAYVSLEILNLFVTGVGTYSESTVGTVWMYTWGWVEAWQTSQIVRIFLLNMREEFAWGQFRDSQ